MSSKEKKLAHFFDKLANIIISFHFYFYLLFSLISICLYYLNFISLFKIISIIMIVTYILELLCGFDRNFLGFGGVIISGCIGYYVTRNYNGSILVIVFAILSVNILKLIFNLLLNKYINNNKNLV